MTAPQRPSSEEGLESRTSTSTDVGAAVEVFLGSRAADRHGALIARFVESGRATGSSGSTSAPGFAPSSLFDSGVPVVLADSRSAADDFVRGEVLQRSGKVRFVERSTPNRLAAQLAAARLARDDLAPMGPLATQAVITRVARRAQEEGRLVRLHEVAGLHGFPDALAHSLRELRLAGLNAGDLLAGRARDENSSTRLEPEVWSDLAVLLEGYEEQLQEWRVADVADRYRAAIDVLQSADSPMVESWLGRDQVWLDLATHSRLQGEFLAQLALRSRNVWWSVPAGDDETHETIQRWSLPIAVRDVDQDSEVEGLNRLQRTQRFVFEPEVPEPVTPGNTDPSFEFLSAAGEGRECVEIARRIRSLAATGVRFDEMAVAVRQPATYLPLLEDALRRADIPAYFARGLARPDPAGRAFLSLLACAADGLSASLFAEYLSLGQVPEPDEGGEPPQRAVPWVEPSGEQLVLASLTGEEPAFDDDVDAPFRAETDPDAEPSQRIPIDPLPTPERWERFLVDAAVVGGSDRWQRRLAGLQREWQLQLTELEEDDDALRQRLERDLGRLRALRRFAMPLIRRLERLPQGGTWGDWLEALEQLAVRSLRRPGSVLRLLGELRPMASVRSVTLDQVRQVLTEPLSFLRAEPPPKRFGRVFVATASEMAARSFRVVFVPGLAEGVFPRRLFEDPLLLDQHRRALREHLEDGALLPTWGERSHRERLLLRLAIGAASENLVVSYPRLDLGQGRSRVPSFYALDLLRAAEGLLPDLRELSHRAAAASASQIGWPAPIDPRDAIDVAEFDLAHLRSALGSKQRGSARFLLEENEHLRRSLHARARRWRSRWTWADGLVVREEDEPAPGLPREVTRQSRQLLQEHSFAQRSYSPTALQHFSSCPYRFLLQAIHRLRPSRDVAGFEQLDPLTRGSLFHDIQFDLMQELRGEEMLPVTLDRLPAVLDRCDEIVDRSARRLEEELAPAIQRIWRSEVETLRNDLRGWLRQMAEEPGWVPIANELAFGLPLDETRDPKSSPEPARVCGGVSLRGSIDLVESDESGTRLRVVDHKTGRPAREQHLVIAGGRILQPVFYALAAEQLLSAPPAQKSDAQTDEGQAPGIRVVEGRLHYCTQRGQYEIRSVALNGEARSAAERVTRAVANALDSGFLPAAPSEGACRWCDYRVVCGPYEEMRVTRKKKGALDELVRLRRVP